MFVLIMKTKIISLYVNFHNNRTIRSTNLLVKTCRCGGGGWKKSHIYIYIYIYIYTGADLGFSRGGGRIFKKL